MPGVGTRAAWHHHGSSQSVTVTNKKEIQIQAMVNYIKERGPPFSTQCPPVFQNFVTEEIITQDIWNDVLNALDRGKKIYENFTLKIYQ